MCIRDRPTVELEERIHSEILDNPALEEGKEMPENEDDNTEYVENCLLYTSRCV